MRGPTDRPHDGAVTTDSGLVGRGKDETDPTDTPPSIAAIPSPPRRPLVGNLLQIPRSRLAQYLLELSRQFDGIFELDFAGIRVPFVYSAELVAELSDESRFRKIIRPPLSMLRKVAGDGLFTAHSNDLPWAKAHRILLPAFSPRAMKGYFDAMLEVANQLADSWEARAGQDILVADDMTRLTLDTISLAGFGYRFNSFQQERLHPFLEAMVRVLSETMAKMTRLPILNRLNKYSAQFLDDIAQMNALVDEVIRRRREQPVDTGDLLNLMLHARDPQTDQRLDDVNIRHQVITFLVAGHETTSGLLTFALYLLLRHPLALARAYAEVDRVLPAGTTPEYAHLARLEVIERVLKETLRLWPTAPAYSVAPYEDTLLGGRYRIPKDQVVTVTIPALHRDPAVWRDPDSFDIDRFLPETEAKLHPHAYKPFGNGERACIGRQFALTEAKLALAVILQRFAIRDPHDYQLRIKETLTLKPDQFYIQVRRRRPEERIAGAPLPRPAAGTELTPQPRLRGDGGNFAVLYGSSLGTARDLAEQIGARAADSGFAVSVAPLDARIDDLPTDGILVVVASTYNGNAPDSARRTEAKLRAGELAALRRPKLRYAVLGCGNSQWRTYQAFPKLIEDCLAASGAQALVARGEADGNGDFDGAVEHWLSAFWQAAGTRETAAAAPRLRVAFAAERDLRAPLLPEGAHTLEVTGNDELVRDPAGLWDFSREAPRASTRHLTLRLPPGVSYRTGDHLAVYPRNRPELVAAIAERLGLSPDTVVILDGDPARARHLPLGRPISIGQLLSDLVELQEPAGRQDLRRLIQHTPCPHTRARLEALVADGAAAAARFQAEVSEPRLTVYQLLLRHPAIRPPLEAFLDGCPAMRPRLYSISSSALASPGELSLTVGTVAGPTWSGAGDYLGTASAYLQGLRPGDTLLGELRRPTPPFAPGDDPAVPMILIGPGTGFAPFRGFLQERAAQRTQGIAVAASLVFYGCRHPEHDWFYREDMRRWEADGIARLHLAFSSLEGHPHRFVQDALWAERDAVWEALQAGATVYVCGDGRRMAPAVRDCLIGMHMERSGSTLEVSSAWLEDMMSSGRYRQDVFVSG